MPRVGEPILLHRDYPWDEWEALLKKSPTKTLYFGEDDFSCLPENFRKQAKKAWAHLNVTVAQRGEEVMVTLA